MLGFIIALFASKKQMQITYLMSIQTLTSHMRVFGIEVSELTEDVWMKHISAKAAS